MVAIQKEGGSSYVWRRSRREKKREKERERHIGRNSCAVYHYFKKKEIEIMSNSLTVHYRSLTNWLALQNEWC